MRSNDDTSHRWLLASYRILTDFEVDYPDLAPRIALVMDLLAANPYAVPSMHEYAGGDVPGRAYVYEVDEHLDVVFGILPTSRRLVLWGIRHWPRLSEP